MRCVTRLAMPLLCAGLLAPAGSAQQSQEKPADAPNAASQGGSANSAAVDAIVTRMMAFDKNQDGQLTRAEVTDERLHRLLDRADADRNGVVTKAELTALATQLVAEDLAAGGGRRGGFGGPAGGGPGGPGVFGPDGPGGFGPGGPRSRGPGGPPPPGQILPAFLQEQLNLTAEQKRQLEDLQRDVDTGLAKILTDDQKKQLAEMRARGPGGFGRPGGPGPPAPPERP